MSRIYKVAILLLLAVLVAVPCSAATTTLGVSTASTTACSTSSASGSFTPAAGDLLVTFVQASDTDANLELINSDGIGFTRVTSASNGTYRLYVFVAGSFARAVSQTVTIGNCAADATTGFAIVVVRVSGVTRAGLSAIKQSIIAEDQTGGGTPAVTFGASVSTSNPTLLAVGNATNAAGLTAPTSWSEAQCSDTGYATPTTGVECVTRDSGFTGTTVTWGSTSASDFGVVGVEVDTTACSTGTCFLVGSIATGSAASSTIASNATDTTAFAASLAAVGIHWSWSAGTPVVSSIADTAGNTYVQGTSCATTQSTNGTDIWYAVNPTTNAANVVTATFSTADATFREIHVHYISGTDTSTPFETCATATTAGATSITTGSFSPAAANNYNFFICHTGDSPFKWPDSNYQIHLSLQTASATSNDRVDAPSGAQTATCNMHTSNNGTVVLASFKKASSAVTSPPQQMLTGVGD